MPNGKVLNTFWSTVVVVALVIVAFLVPATFAWESYGEGGTSLWGAITYTAITPVLFVGSFIGDARRRRHPRPPQAN